MADNSFKDLYLENESDDEIEDIFLYFQISPIEPAVKPTTRKKENSNKSLGKEFINKLI